MTMPPATIQISVALSASATCAIDAARSVVSYQADAGVSGELNGFRLRLDDGTLVLVPFGTQSLTISPPPPAGP